jgi:hypothetical protein
MEIELRPVLLMSEHSRDKPTPPGPIPGYSTKFRHPKLAVVTLLLLPGRAYPLGKLPPFGRRDAPMMKYLE